MRRAALVAAALVTSGCAALVTGTREEVEIRTVPSGARVLLVPGHYEATTPVTLDLPRKDAPYLVRVELDGHQPQRSYIRGDTNSWVWGNVLLGPLGVLIDWTLGTFNDLEPNEIVLELEPLQKEERP